MRSLREAAESGVFPRDPRSPDTRIDALLVAVANLYRRQDALGILWAPESTEEDIDAAVAVMADTSHRDGIYTAVERLQASSPEAMAKHVAAIRNHSLGNPTGDNTFKSTDRSPRVRKAIVDEHDAKRFGVRAGEQYMLVAANGQILGPPPPD